MSNVEIKVKDVLGNKRELNEFINLPWELYKNDSMWIAPLKLSLKELLNKKHPYFDTAQMKFWMAYKNNRPVGRIAVSINSRHNDFHEEKTAFFGFFESIEDEEVAAKLFEVAQAYAKEQGMDKIQGPFNPSTNYECGTLIDGFDDPAQIMMTYNPPYHLKLIEGQDFKKAKDLLAYRRDVNIPMPEVINKVSERIEKSNRITYRKVNKKNWDQEVELMLEIYNSAWEKNWGFIPMTPEEFRHTAKDLKSVVDENLVVFVEVAGKVAGFAVALPDFNQVFKEIPSGKLFPTGIFKLLRSKKYIDRLRVITLGIKEEYRKIGLGSLIYRKLWENAVKANYREAEMSWILEDNLMMNKPLIRMANVYKTYRIFEKSL